MAQVRHRVAAFLDLRRGQGARLDQQGDHLVDAADQGSPGLRLDRHLGLLRGADRRVGLLDHPFRRVTLAEHPPGVVQHGPLGGAGGPVLDRPQGETERLVVAHQQVLHLGGARVADPELRHLLPEPCSLLGNLGAGERGVRVDGEPQGRRVQRLETLQDVERALQQVAPGTGERGARVALQQHVVRVARDESRPDGGDRGHHQCGAVALELLQVGAETGDHRGAVLRQDGGEGSVGEGEAIGTVGGFPGADGHPVRLLETAACTRRSTGETEGPSGDSGFPCQTRGPFVSASSASPDAGSTGV